MGGIAIDPLLGVGPPVQWQGWVGDGPAAEGPEKGASGAPKGPNSKAPIARPQEQGPKKGSIARAI